MSTVYGSLQNEFSVLAYAPKNQETVQFLQNRFSEYTGALGTTLTDYGRQFYQASAAVLESATNSAAMRYASNVLSKVKSAFQRDEIRQMNDIGELQHASLMNQRFIMANPMVRTLYHDQRVSGYEDTYVDAEPGLVRWEHTDYRLATHGMVKEHPEHDWHVSFYPDVFDDVNKQLFSHQKFDISLNWDLLEGCLKVAGGEDPVSATGGLL